MNIYSANFSQDNKFYVYQYLRSRKSKIGDIGSPYYIGKGMRYRAFYKHTGACVPKDREKIEILSENMKEADAFQLEMLLIHLYGRIDMKIGILRNLTDGGKGNAGLRKSQQTKKKISKSLLGRTRPSEVTQKISNSKLGKPNLKNRKPKSAQAKKNIAAGNEGLIWVTNDLIGTKIDPTRWKEFELNGFRKGRPKKSIRK